MNRFLTSLGRIILLVATVIVNVPPADDEQDARVPKTQKQEKRWAQAG